MKGELILNERIKQLRTYLNLSMDKFGQQIGVTRSAISKMESGASNLSEQTIKSICREFNVDYLWLTSGSGEMFVQADDDVYTSIDKIMAGENELHRNLIKWVASLDDSDVDEIDRLISKYNEISK